MGKGMKFYIGKLDVVSGEYGSNQYLKFSTTKRPSAALMAIAKRFYGGKAVRGDGGFYFRGGEVHVSPGTYQKVERTTYDAITVISDLSKYCESESK